jgi:lipopolysaccharide transport system permease protein
MQTMSEGRMIGKNKGYLSLMATKLKIFPDLQDKDWSMVIEPQRSLLDLRLGELWCYKDLVLLFVRRDFVSVYKQTILGPLWHLINPVLTAITFTVIFGQIASLPTDGLPRFLFYMSGTVIWNFFSSCLIGTSGTFIANANIFGKVYFPRLAVPVSVVISKLLSFSIQFAMFLLFLGYFWLAGSNVHPNLWIFLLPIFLLLMAGLGLGLGIIISSLTTRYRDLQYLVVFGIQLWMYATPVIYPISSVPDQLRIFILINPMTPIIETFRYAFLGGGSLNGLYLLYSLGFMLAVLFIGMLMFNRVENTFMDTI